MDNIGTQLRRGEVTLLKTGDAPGSHTGRGMFEEFNLEKKIGAWRLRFHQGTRQP